MKKTIFYVVATLAILGVTSCSTQKHTTSAPASYTMNLTLAKNPMANKYVNLDYGIRVNVQDTRANKNIIHLYDASATSLPTFYMNPGIGSFTSESTRRYMRTMGFNLDADIATDYLLQMDIKEFHIDFLSGVGWQGTVIMEISILDHNRTLVYPKTEVAGRYSTYASATSYTTANQVLNIAYANALEDIDWDRVAFFLHRASSPKQEANKQVSGEGNTALEHATIHWQIESRPQGADVYWRVISSTPEVKNQNYKYLSTTPYESTEVFDIKGLTYNNAGNVQIEIKCEKTGYYSNSKKFNVLSAIDEKEISAMFRLTKEDE